MKKIIFRLLLIVIIINGCKKEIADIESNKHELIISPDTLVFNNNDTVTFVLATKPSTTCDYQITSYPDWLKLSSVSGKILNNPEVIEVISDFKNFAPGVYNGKIEIASTIGNKTLFIKGLVGEQLKYEIPDSLIFSTTENFKEFFIRNDGNVPINYSVTTSNNFISTNNLSGSIIPANQNKFNFTVNRVNMLTGKYYSQIFINLNNKIDTINVCIENFIEQKIKLPTDVIDAEYSKLKDILVYISSSPSKLNIYNTKLETFSSINLDYVPTCLSLSLDGNNAVVGHDGNITYIDLNSKSIIKSFGVSCYALDIVIGNNKWAYVFPKEDQWEQFRCIKLDSINENEFLQTGNSIYAGTKAKLHPSGKYIYGADNGLSPSDIEKYDIQNGVGKFLYDSPYHGDYPMDGDLWFSEDGLRIFTAGRTVLKTSEVVGQDMKYNGKITLSSQYSRPTYINHSAVKNNLYILSTNGDLWSKEISPNVLIHDGTNLTFKKAISLESYMVKDNNGNANFYDAEPYFVFSDYSGDNIFVLTKAKNSGLLNEWAIQKIQIQ
jgi:hypothetical protein